jgi:DNA-binding CsgD family transcriptional regulator
MAARFLLRAREEQMPPELRIAVLRELAPALIATEGPAGFPYLYEALALAAEPALRAQIAHELARAQFTQGFFSDAVAILEREAHDAREDLATIAVLDLGVLTRMGGLDAIAARAPGATVGAWIDVARHPPASTGADRAEAALARPLEDTALAAALVALMAAGRLEEADAVWTGVADAARAAGALERLRFAVALRARVRLRLGRVAAVEADVRELIAWMTDLQVPFPDARVGLPWAVTPLVEALIERGALEEAQGWMSQTGLEADWPEVFGFTFVLDCLGQLRLAQGRIQEAVRVLRECSRRQRAWGIRNPGFLAWRSSLALALARTGRRTEALDLCDEEIHLARVFGVAREEGMALRALGVITGEPAILEEAVAVLQPSPARLEYARALTDLGAARAARDGGASAAREPLRAGLDLAVRLGATALAERAQRALVATGAKPRRLVLTGADALTAAQLRVARLAADGLGNRAIAEALFLTEKTVEGHLGHAYRKLGIRSRTQLAVALEPGA